MTWREVAQQSAQIAAGFQKLGLKRGDRVAMLLGNRIEFVLTMLGAAHAGLVTVLLSTRQQKPEIAYVLTDCGAQAADPRGRACRSRARRTRYSRCDASDPRRR